MLIWSRRKDTRGHPSHVHCCGVRDFGDSVRGCANRTCNLLQTRQESHSAEAVAANRCAVCLLLAARHRWRLMTNCLCCDYASGLLTQSNCAYYELMFIPPSQGERFILLLVSCFTALTGSSVLQRLCISVFDRWLDREHRIPRVIGCSFSGQLKFAHS